MRKPLIVVTGVDPTAMQATMASLVWALPDVVAIRHVIEPITQQLSRFVSSMHGSEDTADIDLQHAIAQEHWYVCGYKMNMKHPITEETHHLFHDADPSTPMFRVVVQATLSLPMAANLVASTAKRSRTSTGAEAK